MSDEFLQYIEKMAEVVDSYKKKFGVKEDEEKKEKDQCRKKTKLEQFRSLMQRQKKKEETKS